MRVDRGAAAAGIREGHVEPIIAYSLAGIDGYCKSLADTQEQVVRGEGVDRDKIGLNDSEVMANKRDRKCVFH